MRKTTVPITPSPAAAPASAERKRWLLKTLGWVLLAAAAFHLAYAFAWSGFLTILYLFALLQLTAAPTWRKAFYPGLAVGVLLAAWRLDFFVRIFGPGAGVLWLVFGFWFGLFVALARVVLQRQAPPCRRSAWWRWALIPFLWCGLEYFRSELYYLRFAWLTPGLAFSPVPQQLPLPVLGTYGAGLVLMALACTAAALSRVSRLRAGLVVVAGMGLLWLAGVLVALPQKPVRQLCRVAGVQMEFPEQSQLLERLNTLITTYPEAELLVLSEYTLIDSVPAALKVWCRQHHRYLLVGGEEPVPAKHSYFNTAFVVSPEGEVVFRQEKCVPIQFMKDGLPAPSQKLWASPWGRMGICICYDLSYSRVTDQLIRQGAELLLVPTMDVADWGLRQHQLHGRVAPMRAAEYGVPIFRLASSGISQAVDCHGRVLAATPALQPGAMLYAELPNCGPGHWPLDRWLAPFSVALSTLGLLWMGIGQVTPRLRKGRRPARAGGRGRL